VKVSIEDQYGNVETKDTTVVSLSLVSGTLGGTTSSAAVAGVAMFSSLSISTPGTYTLKAADVADGLPPTTKPPTVYDSNAFTLTIGPAAKLVFTREPANGTAGATMGEVIVKIEDKFGNIETTDTSNVILGLSTGKLVSGTPVAAVAGVATFTGLVTDLAGTNELVASDTTDKLGGFESTSFTIASAAPEQCVFVTEPATTTAGTTMTVRVAVEDLYNNIVTYGSSYVILSLTSGTLDGTVKVSTVFNEATFTTIYITAAGTYTLNAADSSYPGIGGTSTTFKITPAAASKVVWTEQPQGAGATEKMSPMQVTVEDKYGNVETTNTSTVKLTLIESGAVKTLNGTTSVAAVGGVATFNDVIVPTAGTYYLRASDGSLTTANSSTFVITPAPAFEDDAFDGASVVVGDGASSDDGADLSGLSQLGGGLLSLDAGLDGSGALVA